MKSYKLSEHTPMGDRETNLTVEIKDGCVTGNADVDAGPGERAVVEFTEGTVTRDGFSFLITLGGMPRRYRVAVRGEKVAGEVTFEGDSELAGIKTPFDGKVGQD